MLHHGRRAARLAEALATATPALPPLVRDVIGRIHGLDKRVRAETRTAGAPARLQSVPGIAPITTAAIEAFLPPLGAFRRGGDLFGGQAVPRTVC
ncbi:MAG: hypothetical protein AAGI50_00370 [Pseudomonadota bacterium]